MTVSFAIFSSRYRRSFSAICCFTGPICNDKNNHHLPREQTTIRHNYYCPSALSAMQSRAMRQLHFACSKVKVCGHVRHAPLPPNCFLLTRNSHNGPHGSFFVIWYRVSRNLAEIRGLARERGTRSAANYREFCFLPSSPSDDDDDDGNNNATVHHQL